MKKDIVSILKEVGAVLVDDHFVLTSGRHSPIYINKDALYPHTIESSIVGKMFAEKYKDQTIDVVVGPALGGIVLSQWVAHHLTQLHDSQVLGVYTEKDSQGEQVFSRGYDQLVKDKQVLVIEDLTTTGASVKKVAQEVEKAGGKVVEICVMINRNPNTVDSESLGFPFDSLGELAVEDYPEDNCPLCEQGVAVNTNMGHGKEFSQQQN